MRSLDLLLSVATAASLCKAAPDPLITPAPVLVARQDNPQLVGYIAANSSDVRTCDPTATFSTSGSFAQCCNIDSDSCAFYTACSSNTLFAAGTSVPCDYTSVFSCNTAKVVSTNGANSGVSYLGCWATSLGTDPFTIVRSAVEGSSAASTDDSSSATSSAVRTTGTGSRTSSAASSRSEASSSTGTATGSAASTSRTNAASLANPMAGSAGILAFLAYILA